MKSASDAGNAAHVASRYRHPRYFPVHGHEVRQGNIVNELD
jgi:hypothetical protein